MTEYVIVILVTVLVGFSSFPFIINALNGLYGDIAFLVGLPIP